MKTTYKRTPQEARIIDAFVASYFTTTPDTVSLTPDEEATVREIVAYVDHHFGRRKFILGLALDFTLLAERVSGGSTANGPSAADSFEPGLTEDDIFARYSHVTHRGEADDLATLTLQDAAGQVHGIRRTEREVIELFHTHLGRSNYPSSDPHTTGQWHRFRDLLTLCFRLSRTGRYVTVQVLLDYGLTHLAENTTYTGSPHPRLYPLIVEDYPRGKRRGENGGVVFQGIVYGYVKADRPHLSVLASRVRTGSSRQKRIGDIDGYYGLDLALTVEVKDFVIDETNWGKEVGPFLEKVRAGGTLGIAFVRGIAAETRQRLEAEGLVVMTQADLLVEVERWDWPKQNAAVLGLLHYLSHVEQNPVAYQRLLRFIAKQDPDHDALRHLDADGEEDGQSSFFD